MVRLSTRKSVLKFEIKFAPTVTIKDHKETFPSKVDCRLINPAKNHPGRISNQILDKINQQLRTRTGSNQWKSTDNVINWFNKIPNKSELTFFKFDIVSFYPSISEKTTDKCSSLGQHNDSYTHR